MERIGQRWSGKVRRHARKDLSQPARKSAHPQVNLFVLARVARTDQLVRGELRGRPAGIAPQRDRPPIGLRREDPHLGLDQPQTVLAQPKLARNGGPESANRVGQRRHTHARRNLGRLGHSADLFSAFQHDDPQSGARQVRRADQAVVARADDDRVVGTLPTRQAARSSSAVRPVRRPRSTAIAAFRPGAPVITPPG